ncbi:MAG: vanadium-dependent haloperoxidase [Actinomycetota bacterium]
MTVVPSTSSAGVVADDPGVIADWNAVAVATIVVDAGKANAEAFMWYAYEQAAVYNAVVGITRRYELYKWGHLGPQGASPEAAAAVAAHDVLLKYFPGSETRLTDALTASLGAIPDGSAKDAGVAYGAQAALRIIELRADDGRFGDVTFDEPEAPGVWRPTPPTFTPFFDPWLAELEPFMRASPSQFRPGPPPGLKTDVYTREFREVKRLGSLTSEDRTPGQTQTALFFSDIGVGPVQAGLRDLVTRLGMDISDSARVFAAVDLSVADAIIASWDAKLHYHWWRPITAIQLANTDGNPNTSRGADWEPLIINPPYPDYPSGLNPVIAATGRALAGLLGLGGGEIDLYLTSVAADETRHYTTKAQLIHDAVDSRVWSGIHFRTADRVGAEIGKLVARRAMSRFFQPTS